MSITGRLTRNQPNLQNIPIRGRMSLPVKTEPTLNDLFELSPQQLAGYECFMSCLQKVAAQYPRTALHSTHFKVREDGQMTQVVRVTRKDSLRGPGFSIKIMPNGTGHLYLAVMDQQPTSQPLIHVCRFRSNESQTNLEARMMKEIDESIPQAWKMLPL